jgi:hypothetical protein
MLPPEFGFQSSFFQEFLFENSKQLEILRGRWENNIKDDPSTSTESRWTNILEVKPDGNVKTEVSGRLIEKIVNYSAQKRTYLTIWTTYMCTIHVSQNYIAQRFN